ncbi:viral replicase [Aconite virus A]|uniref:Viral replicase n=1 Tax=Aconite virus A TaxID=2764701 RepID=A0A8K1DQT3_9VIRU|nr:viral replicase [Aconite virus A]QNJ34493.1 viral replicase [Aconite virus A]
MALTYRSPLEEVLSSFTTSEQSLISATAVDRYKYLEKENFGFFNYALEAHSKERLIQAGIYLSPFSGVPHSHPVCKTLENYILYTVLPNYVNSDFYLVGIKQGKVNFLKQRCPSLNMVNVLNRYVTSHDRLRYGADFVCAISGNMPENLSSRICYNSDTLRDLVPHCIRSKARSFFLHDELHYWSKRELKAFLSACKPRELIGTLIYPPELLIGCPESLNPWCYKYTIHGKDFEFAPDGEYTESYIQRLDSGYLLQCNKIKLEDGSIYCVDVLASKFAHHVIAITRGDAVVRRKRSFSGFEATTCTGLDNLAEGTNKLCIRLPCDVTIAIYKYLRTLQKPDVQSAVAKLGQLVRHPTAYQIKFVREFSAMVIKHGDCDKLFGAESLIGLKKMLAASLPRSMVCRVAALRDVSLGTFVNTMQPFGFTIALHELGSIYDDLLLGSDDWVSDEAPEKILASLEGLYDKARVGGNLPVSTSYGPFGYCDVVEVNPKVVVGCLVWLLVKSHCYFSLSRLDSAALEAYITVVFRRSFFGPACLEAKALRWYARKCEAALLELCAAYRARVRHHAGSVSWFIAKRMRRSFSRYLTYPVAVSGLAVGEFNIDGSTHAAIDALVLRRKANKRIRAYANLCLSLCAQTRSPSPSDGLNPWGIGPTVSCVEEIQGEVTSREGEPQVRLITRADLEVVKPAVASSSSEKQRTTKISAKLVDSTSSMPDSAWLDLMGHCAERRVDGGGAVTLSIKTFFGGDLLPQGTPDKLRMRHAARYTRDGCTEYSYNGGSHKSRGWDMTFDKLFIINDIDGDAFDCCLAQKYEAGGAIGFHSDDEQIFQVGCPILTINAFGSATFRVKFGEEVKAFQIQGSEYFIMPEHFQETHKHSVTNCTSGRMSFTFRKLAAAGDRSKSKFDEGAIQSSSSEGGRPEGGDLVAGDGALQVVKAGASGQTAPGNVSYTEVAMLGCLVCYKSEPNPEQFVRIDVPGDGNCFYHAVGYFIKLGGLELKKAAFRNCSSDELNMPAIVEQMHGSNSAEGEAVCLVARKLKMRIRVHDLNQKLCATFSPVAGFDLSIDLVLENEHYNVALPRNGCVLTAICEALGRPRADILKVLSREENKMIMGKLEEGNGLTFPVVEKAMAAFGIRCIVDNGEGLLTLNEHGTIERCFTFFEDHLAFVKRLDGFCFSSRDSTQSPGAFVSRSALALLDCAGSKINAVFELGRAEKLIDSLHSGLTGIMSSELFNSRNRLVPLTSSVRLGRSVTTILGTFGSGKSTLYQNFFQRALGKHVHFVSPRKVLAGAFRDELNNLRDSGGAEISKEARKGWVVCTFETFVLNHKKVSSSHVVILDEVQLFPPGYLDLIAYLLPPQVLIYLAGDPCQSEYDNERDRAFLEPLGNNLEHLLGGENYRYATLSHRFTYNGFIGRLPCEIREAETDNDGAIELYNGLDELSSCAAEIILVSSFTEKNAIKAYAPPGAKIMTYGESTGLTVSHSAIIISQASRVASEARWLTALSRARKQVSLFSTLEGHESRVVEYFSNRVLGNFLGVTATLGDLTELMPGRPKFVEDLIPSAGADFMVAELKLAGDPWLKSSMFLGQRSDIQEPAIEDEDDPTVIFRTHLLRSEMENSRVAFIDNMLAKENREKRMGRLVSDQFSEDHSKNNGYRLTNAAERFEAIYPRHRGSDTVTFIMAARKRLRFSKPSIEMAKLASAKVYGPFMLEEFLKHVPLKPGLDKQLMEESVAEFEKKKLSKSAAIIENHAGRSNSDWPVDTGLVFMKSQHCTKFGNRCQIAKAAQSIVCFQHFVLCRFAPYMRYIEKKLHQVLPPNFYIHSGKGLDELNAWVKIGKFSGVCTESDYEAFDASQDHFIMAFEIEVMRYLRLPVDLINDYIFIKTHLGSKLGNFAIMRFSGEASTFLFNTMANMLFTFLRYDLNGKEFICFAGDDMCAAKRLRHRSTYEDFMSKLKLKAKVDFTAKPTFCGWNLCPDGIYKKPQLLYERMCIAMETNNLASCLDNYALEASYAYKLGERAIERMDELELASHYNCVRLIVKKKYLLKSGVADLFKDTLV